MSVHYLWRAAVRLREPSSPRKVSAEEEAAEPEQSEEEEFNGSRLLNRSRLH